jgi:hypothetical protein
VGPRAGLDRCVKEERLLSGILKNRCHLWPEHIIRRNEFVLKVLEGEISGKIRMEDHDCDT